MLVRKLRIVERLLDIGIREHLVGLRHEFRMHELRQRNAIVRDHAREQHDCRGIVCIRHKGLCIAHVDFRLHRGIRLRQVRIADSLFRDRIIKQAQIRMVLDMASDCAAKLNDIDVGQRRNALVEINRD